jgi:ABC-2 type transport system permease protein
MNAILVLLRKDFALFLRDRASLSLTFIVPFALIYLFGQIYRVNSSDPGPSGIPVAVVNQSDDPAAARLVDALKSEKAFKVMTRYVNGDKTSRPLAEDDLRPLMRQDSFRFALVIPKDVVRTDRIGIHLKTYSNPRNEIEAQTVNGILQKTLFSKVPELLGKSAEARARDYLGEAGLDRFDSSIASAVSESFGGDPTASRRTSRTANSASAAWTGDRPAGRTGAKPPTSSRGSSPWTTSRSRART